ncbi:11656_t:CDS:2, partial [Racocetra persica]
IVMEPAKINNPANIAAYNLNNQNYNNIATISLEDKQLPKLNDKNWKEKTAQYKVYDELQLDIKEKELCTECKYPYNEKELTNRYCNDCYKEATKCIGCKQPTPITTLKNAKCTICFQMKVENQRKQEKDQIHEIEKKEFVPSKKLKVTTKIEEFNFDKIERTEIEQMKQEIIDLKKIKINNTLHLDNIELQRKLEEHRERDYLTQFRQITTWRNQAIAEFIILGQEYSEEKFDNLHKEYLKKHDFDKLYKTLDNLQDTSDEESRCPNTPQQVKEYTPHYTPSTPV